jgi:hypothetical protein
MEKILKKGSKGVVVKIYAMGFNHEDENNPEELIYTLEKNYRIFEEIPKGPPPYRDHELQIELIPGSTPNKMTYRCPHQQKGEIEKMVQYMLDLGIIQPRS